MLKSSSLRADNDVMQRLERSPWHGLSGAQLLEFQEACRIARLTHETDVEVEERVAAKFAKRATLLLVDNDLHGALWAADIAASAFAGVQRRQTYRKIQPVVDEHPHPAERRTTA